jgi:hypothetical protein
MILGIQPSHNNALFFRGMLELWIVFFFLSFTRQPSSTTKHKGKKEDAFMTGGSQIAFSFSKQHPPSSRRVGKCKTWD